jgi:hypothetical protein
VTLLLLIINIFNALIRFMLYLSKMSCYNHDNDVPIYAGTINISNAMYIFSISYNFLYDMYVVHYLLE